MQRPFNRPKVIPGQFWLRAWVQDSLGRKLSRTAHALIHAPDLMQAAHAPIVEITRQRLEEGLTKGVYEIHLNVEPRRERQASNGK